MGAGDLVHFGCGVRYNGMIPDAGKSFVLGAEPTADQSRLLTGTQKALDAANAQVKGGGRVGDIGASV